MHKTTEGADGKDPGLWRNTEDLAVSGNQASHPGAMAICIDFPVSRGWRVQQIRSSKHAPTKIGMLRVHARINDGYDHTFALADGLGLRDVEEVEVPLFIRSCPCGCR